MALPQRPSQGAFRVGHVRAEESGLAFWEPVCTENPIRIDGATESPKLVE
jgi:hypothetical protein